MYFGDHVPPHFHALYAEFEALIDIQTLEAIRGELPRRAVALVLEWAQQHRDELMKDSMRRESNANENLPVGLVRHDRTQVSLARDRSRGPARRSIAGCIC